MISSKKYKKKLVVCLSRFPYPLEKGDKLRAFFQIRDLSESFDIFLICTTDVEINENSYNKLKPYCKEIHVFRLNKLHVILNLFLAIFSRLPFQIHYFTQTSIKVKINKLLHRIQPDHIYCQLVRPAEYVKNYHACKKTIDIMDALSIGMERRMNASNFFIKPILKEECLRLKKYEQKIINYFENITIISNQDKEFIMHPKQKEFHVLPNGVNEIFLTPLAINKSNKILFTGNMSYFPNVEAAKYIHSELLDEITKRELFVEICGANPSKKIIPLSSNEFKITGWVDDIKEHYASAFIFIAPIFSGSGMQNKILEAMAIGLPCITTSLANNAILAKENEQILIANSKSEFIEKIVYCQQNPDFYSKLAENGKKFIAENYNWKKLNVKLAEILQN